MAVQRFPLPSINAPIDPSAASAYRDYQRQRQMTLGDLLLENRIILLQGEIYDGNANELVMKLLYLQSENRRKDMKKLFVVYLVGIGTVITFLLGIERESQEISWVFFAAFVLTFLWYGMRWSGGLDRLPNEF